jgi:hypothetical protein
MIGSMDPIRGARRLCQGSPIRGLVPVVGYRGFGANSAESFASLMFATILHKKESHSDKICFIEIFASFC